MPRPCAVRTICSHVSAGSLPFVSTHRTSSSRISAAVPGIVPRPWRFASCRNSSNDTPSFVAPLRISIGLNACTCICGRAPLHRVDDVEVEGARQVRVDAPLHAHLGGASAPRFLRAVGDLLERERVRLVVDLALGEGAEAAAHVADVREVDVPVDHVRDVVADRFGAQAVGDPTERVERVALGAEQRQRLVIADRPVRLGLRRAPADVGVETLGRHRCVGPRGGGRGHVGVAVDGRRRRRAARRPHPWRT